MHIDDLMFGLRVTAIGMGIVFAALYVLQLVMVAMRKIFYDPKMKKAASAPVAEPLQEDAVVGGLSPAVVAAIAAAVSSFFEGRPANVISIRREGEVKTPWQQVARASAATRKSN